MMSRRMKLVWLSVAAAVLAVAAFVRPAAAAGGTHGLLEDEKGNLFCGGECAQGQRCCVIKILP